MQNSKTAAWIHAARLRTLPLAMSGALMGSFVALQEGGFRWQIFLLAIVTALLLQILSNLANDYGDSVNGADNEERVGPLRAVQSGAISPSEMKKAVILMSVLAFVTGIVLIVAGIGFRSWIPWLVLMALGVMAIFAAILYTAGTSPYGYIGLGDLFVFLFFGIAAVAGTFYLHTGRLPLHVLAPASVVGLLSTAVLNLNNMRDIAGDARSGKRTIAVLLGSDNAKIYHAILVLGAISLFIIWSVRQPVPVWRFLYVLTIPLLIFHLGVVFRNRIPMALDPQLKKLAISTLLLVVLYGAGLLF